MTESLVIAPPSTIADDPPALPAGVYQATCTEIKNLPDQPSKYSDRGRQDLVLFKFRATIDRVPHQALRFYKPTLHEKSHLRRDIGHWRGKAYSDEELANGFDVMRLVQQTCTITVAAVLKDDGGSDAKVVAIGPPDMSEDIPF